MSQEEKKGIVRLTYTHDAMIDLILKEPTVTYEELAEIFGFSRGWISRVVGSDAFQARLAERKATLIDPQIARSINERLRGVTVRAIDVIADKLDKDEVSAAYALDALGIATQGMVRK